MASTWLSSVEVFFSSSRFPDCAGWFLISFMIMRIIIVCKKKIQLIEKSYKCNLSSKNIQANKSTGLYSARQTVPGSRVTEPQNLTQSRGDAENAKKYRLTYYFFTLCAFYISAPLRWVFIIQTLLHTPKTEQFRP